MLVFIEFVYSVSTYSVQLNLYKTFRDTNNSNPKGAVFN